MATNDEGLVIETFTDSMVFSMDPDLIDWDMVDEMSVSDPSSREYRTMMRKLRITGRNSRTTRGLRDCDE